MAVMKINENDLKGGALSNTKVTPAGINRSKIGSSQIGQNNLVP
jgi:hypothetical protein